MKKFIVFLVCSVAALISCDNSIASLEFNDRISIPLATGTYWNYNEVASDTDPSLISATLQKRVVSIDTLANSIIVAKFESINTRINRDPIITHYYWYLDETGLSEYSSLSDTLGYKHLLFPLEEGKQWISNRDTFKVVSMSKSVQVDRKDFENCVEVVRINGDAFNQSVTYYWKDEIGLIKTVSDISNAVTGLRLTMYLTEHGGN